MDCGLERFKSAQAHSYNNALREIRNGHKTSHWMWYIFLQLRELGRSSMAIYYGISSAEEARAYLSDPVLGPRLVETSEALLQLENKDANSIGHTDEKTSLLHDALCCGEPGEFCFPESPERLFRR